MSKTESITLYFKEGSSDKEYSIQLLESKVPEQYVVNFAYGRRGGPMKQGTKTTSPVPYTKALLLYKALVHEKQLKGYTASETAVAFSDNPNTGQDTEYRPQLVNEVDWEDALAFYRNNVGDVAMQIKWDGERRGVMLNKTGNVFANRTGKVTTVSEEIRTACEKFITARPLIRSMTWDCEDMGSHLRIFDVLEIHGIDQKEKTFKYRTEMLDNFQYLFGYEGHSVLRVDKPFYPQTLQEFQNFINTCETNREEGVIIRRASSYYRPGRPNSGGDCLKMKFTASATCRVTGHSANKSSITICVLDANEHLIEIGKVTIPPNYDKPPIGALVEVKYMNILPGEGASLFQPRYKGIRIDKSKPDYYSTLKFKRGEED